MDNLEKGINYLITIPLTFEGRFSHIEEKNGVKYACFAAPGVNRYGETYRKVPVESILRTTPSDE